MRKLATLGALALIAVPAGVADASPNSDAQKQCRTERTAMGAQVFKDTYGTNKNKSNAFGKCVSQRTSKNKAAEKSAKKNAAKQCKEERAADQAAFQEKWGTGKNKKNAYGKCVSATAKSKNKKEEK